MRRQVCVVLFLLAAGAMCSWADEPLTIASHWPRSGYTIVVPESSIASERYAAEELARFLAQSTSDVLPVVTDEAELPEKAILVGPVRQLEELGVKLDVEKLGKEGFVLKTVGKRLVIAGGRPRGTLYGVYEVLDKYLGCRFFAPNASLVPTRLAVEIPPLDETDLPAFAVRDVVAHTADPVWLARNRLNGSRVEALCDETKKYGGAYVQHRPHPPGGAHTLSSYYCSVGKYGKDHPEYFALHDGERRTEGLRSTNLCLSNPDVLRIVTGELRTAMRDHPECQCFWVAPEDNWVWCACRNCKKEMDEYGGPSGQLVHFLNQLCDAVNPAFSDKRIAFYAYHKTRVPPTKPITGHRNLVVYDCGIGRCSLHSLAECEFNKGRRRDGPEKWLKVATMHKFYYDNYPSTGDRLPAPNLAAMGEDVAYLHKMGVTGLQVCGGQPWAPESPIHYYVWARMLWEPTQDPWAVIDEFCNGYYGAAGPHLTRYFRLICDEKSIFEEDSHMKYLYKFGGSGHACAGSGATYTWKALMQANQLFEKAQQAVAYDGELTGRVKALRCVLWHSIFRKGHSGQVKVTWSKDDPRIVKRAAKEFFAIATDHHIAGFPGYRGQNAYRDAVFEGLGILLEE